MIDVSIIVATYNHSKYIEKAIRSILMQKVNFEYEVLIGEDCSTDNTKFILKKLLPELPSNFHIFFRTHNMGLRGDNNFNDLYSRMKGRYYIVLEGDDFWTYPYKLQSQYDFLENHNQYIAVAHNTLVVDEDDNVIDWDYPECKDNEFTLNDLEKGLLPGQTTTIFMRNYITYSMFDCNLSKTNQPGDRKKAFLLVVNGRIKCIQKRWSAYRLVTRTGSSFSAMNKNVKVDYLDLLEYYCDLYKYTIKGNYRREIKKIAHQMYIKYMYKCYILKRANISFSKLLNEILVADNSVAMLGYILMLTMKFPIDKIIGLWKLKLYRKATKA